MSTWNRLNSLQEKLIKQKLGALLVTSRENIRYLSGFSGSAGALLVTRQKAYLFTDGRYGIQAEAEVQDAQVQVTDKPLQTLGQLLEQFRIKRLGIEARHLTVADYNSLKKALLNTAHVIASHDLVENLRQVKEAQEIKNIKKAVKIAAQAFADIQECIAPGISEKELAGKLECALRERGSEKSPFEIIVASGRRSAMPHAVSSEKRLAEGELVIFDFGATLDGYNADISRTLVLGNTPSSEQKRIYRAVAKAQSTGIKAIKPGVRSNQVDKTARGVIEKAGYGEYFNHSSGHGIGLQVHEAPRISQADKTVLQEGMVFTMEPGVYLPELGGVRIEDMVLVTGNGCQVLTKEVTKKEF